MTMFSTGTSIVQITIISGVKMKNSYIRLLHLRLTSNAWQELRVLLSLGRLLASTLLAGLL